MGLTELSFNGDILKCPSCDSDHMHMSGLGKYCEDVMNLMFWCEGCGDGKTFMLSIETHEGSTCVSWSVVPSINL